MVSKKNRNEVWDRNQRYIDDPETVEDLKPICKRICKLSDSLVDPKTGEWCKRQNKCPAFQLWLSNESLEWSMDSGLY